VEDQHQPFDPTNTMPLGLTGCPPGLPLPTHNVAPHFSSPGLSAPCPSDTTAGPVSSSQLPYPAWPWAALSWAHTEAHSPARPWPVPVPSEVPDVRGWGCPGALGCLLLAEVVGWALDARPCPVAPWGAFRSLR